MAFRPPCSLFNTTFSTNFATSQINKHARIVEIGQHQIQKPMKLSQLKKRIQQYLTNSKDIIQKTESRRTEVAGPDQRATEQIQNCVTVQSNTTLPHGQLSWENARSVERLVAGSTDRGRTNLQGLKITEKKVLPL